MKREDGYWFWVSIGLLIASVLTLFFPILLYTPAGSNKPYRFSIVDLLTDSSFERIVLNDYTGYVYWDIRTGTVVILSVMAVAAIICAIIGLVTLRAQYPSNMQFALAVIGAVGTAIPSILIFIAISMSKSGFRGTVRCGLYPIVTPIAMVAVLVLVINRFRRVLERRKAEQAARGLIRRAGDL